VRAEDGSRGDGAERFWVDVRRGRGAYASYGQRILRSEEIQGRTASSKSALKAPRLPSLMTRICRCLRTRQSGATRPDDVFLRSASVTQFPQIASRIRPRPASAPPDEKSDVTTHEVSTPRRELVTAREGRRPSSELKSESEILGLLRPLYADIGGNPDALVAVTPSYGGWLNSLRFRVHRADGASIWVTRTDINSQNRRGLLQALRSFAHEANIGSDPAHLSPRQAKL
jgi:hypothetical protein